MSGITPIDPSSIARSNTIAMWRDALSASAVSRGHFAGHTVSTPTAAGLPSPIAMAAGIQEFHQRKLHLSLSDKKLSTAEAMERPLIQRTERKEDPHKPTQHRSQASSEIARKQAAAQHRAMNRNSSVAQSKVSRARRKLRKDQEDRENEDYNPYRVSAS